MSVVPPEQAAVQGHPPPYWPGRVAVYGTLRRTGSAWRLLQPWVLEEEEAVILPGTLYDTSCGYPALRLGAGPGAAADVFRLREPAKALPMLDRYEGPEYCRVRLRLPGDRTSWVYVWRGQVEGFRPLPGDGRISSAHNGQS
jgi:gamma-glutamylcyclotransferase (GGCT)/AIG2-like uncharacterized protein YtfP